MALLADLEDGNDNVKIEPPIGRFLTSIFSPCNSVTRFVICKPKPVPGLLVSPGRTNRLKGLNISAISLGGIPGLGPERKLRSFLRPELLQPQPWSPPDYMPPVCSDITDPGQCQMNGCSYDGSECVNF